MISGMATPSTVAHTGCHWPAGRTRATAASGTNTSSNTTVSEPVARMPIASQVCSIETPGAANGTDAWTTCAPSAPSWRKLVTTTSPAGAPLAGDLRAVTR